MDAAFAWIGQIADWLGRFVPRWMILDVTTHAVKYRRGQPVHCTPGIVWWWPATSTVDTYPIVRQTDDLRSQTIVTTDDKTILVGGMVIYEVFDIMLLLPRTFRAQQAIKEISLTCIHEVCCRLSWAELKEKQRKGTLDTLLKNETKKSLEEYGVRVIKVQLTDLAPTKVVKLVQAIGKDEEGS